MARFDFLETFMRDRNKFTIHNDPFDVQAFEDGLEDATRVQGVLAEGIQELPTFRPLAVDLYCLLFKSAPELLDAKFVRRDHRANHLIVDQVMGTTQYQQLHQCTQGDEFSSILAVEALAKASIEILRRNRTAIDRQSTLVSQVQTVRQQLRELGDVAVEDPTAITVAPVSGDPDSEDEEYAAQNEVESEEEESSAPEGAALVSNQEPPPPAEDDLDDTDPDPELLRQRAELRERLEQIEHELDALDESLEDNTLDVRQTVRQALDNSLNDVQEVSDILSQWGTEEGGELRMDYQERMALADKIRNTPKLMELAKMLGRYKLWAMAASRTKVKSTMSEITTITLGNDLEHIVPSELVCLGHDVLKYQFYQQFYEAALMCYEVKHRFKEREGSIIVCMDESGSMMGSKELWMKALCVALAEMAKQRKRNFAVIEYSYRNTIRTHQFLNGHIPPQALLDIATHFYCGGTDFETPLMAALDIIEKEGFKKADVLFITDGECGVRPTWLTDFLDRKKAMDFKITSVCVDFGYSHDGSIKSFSDEVINCSHFAKEMDRMTQEVFEAI